MMLQLNKSILENYRRAIHNEWLETNGLGGWSSSTVIGCNTWRYHGLLVAATVPPAERMALVSKLDETIIAGDKIFELATNNYGQAIHPKGYQYLTGFTKKFFPEFIYDAGGTRLKKTIAMIHGENTVVIIYDVMNAGRSFTLELLPLLSARGYHNLKRANDSINRQASFDNDIFKTKLYEGTPVIFIKVPGANYCPGPQWFYNFNYSVEQYRGLDFIEDLFAHGKFNFELNAGDSLGIIISTDDPGKKDAHELLEQELERRKKLLTKAGFSKQAAPEKNPSFGEDLASALTLAADQFIVKRTIHSSSPTGGDLEGATIIAGYYWFTDWGRDTMISLPGLCLSTGRLDDAKKIISAFANNISMGMLPNRFRDNGEAPEYNNVDGTLWYFIAVYKYLQSTGDKNFVLDEILPGLKDIIDWHFKGTRYNIHVDDDGLLYAGEKEQQLTWMDARIGSWVVTPRRGKPVEIEALWYNALRIFAELLKLNHQENDASLVNLSAEKVKQSFIRQFWYEEGSPGGSSGLGNYLYDVIDEYGNPDYQIRPNQLFAISLPFALIEGRQAKAVLQIVEEQLYTHVGLKSLTPGDPHYIPVYGGDLWHRDSSYHQGTVWSWLLGPYIDAIMKVEGSKGKPRAQSVIDNFKYHFNEACIGSISEIFDADAPHHPGGCVAQAWSVAELLRVIKTYGLDDVEADP